MVAVIIGVDIELGWVWGSKAFFAGNYGKICLFFGVLRYPKPILSTAALRKWEVIANFKSFPPQNRVIPIFFCAICIILSIFGIETMGVVNMKTAVFDRDGVINLEVGHVTKAENFVLSPGIKELFERLRADEYTICVITNQGGIALGLHDRALLDVLHGQVRALGATDIFFCPHHPTRGRCLCRKPQTLFFERIRARYSATDAVMVGDRVKDLAPAGKMGWKTVRIGGGYADEPPFKPDFEYPDPLALFRHYDAVFGSN
jgi:D-glycero-D-manno-heptose 1,7-bisphosphate phosphatase